MLDDENVNIYTISVHVVPCLDDACLGPNLVQHVKVFGGCRLSYRHCERSSSSHASRASAIISVTLPSGASRVAARIHATTCNRRQHMDGTGCCTPAINLSYCYIRRSTTLAVYLG